jgi:hypothetical protein
MTCQVKNCQQQPVTTIDLDPKRVGGWSSYSYEVPLCQVHADAINGGASWVVHDSPEGVSGWEVLVGEQVKDLGKYLVATVPAGPSSGEMNARSSEGLLPRGFMLPLTAHQVGSSGAPTPLELYINAEQSRALIKALELHAKILEDQG